MPDIYAECKPLTPTLLLLVGFLGGDGKVAKEVALSRKEMVRLVDKAVREYTLARRCLLAQIGEKRGVIHILGFVDSMENCLNACRRLFYFFERIRGIPKVSRGIIRFDAAKIMSIRDTMEHMAERIEKSLIQPGQPLLLTPTKDGRAVSLGQDTLQFERLAFVLKIFHKVTEQLLKN